MHHPRRGRRPWPLRRRHVAGVIAVGTLAVMSAFVHVVAQGVQQQRRAESAAHEQVLRRCNALPQADLRLQCLQEQWPAHLPLQTASGLLT